MLKMDKRWMAFIPLPICGMSRVIGRATSINDAQRRIHLISTWNQVST